MILTLAHNVPASTHTIAVTRSKVSSRMLEPLARRSITWLCLPYPLSCNKLDGDSLPHVQVICSLSTRPTYICRITPLCLVYTLYHTALPLPRKLAAQSAPSQTACQVVGPRKPANLLELSPIKLVGFCQKWGEIASKNATRGSFASGIELA